MLLPTPLHLRQLAGALSFSHGIRVVGSRIGSDAVGHLLTRLRHACGVTTSTHLQAATLRVHEDPSLAEEEYCLSVTESGVTVTVSTSRSCD